MSFRSLTLAALLVTATAAAVEPTTVPTDPAQVAPLAIGATMPSVTVRNPDGSPRELGPGKLSKPTIVIFYRGGWCPYCNRHMGAIKRVEPDLVGLGYDLLFLSSDRPDILYSSLKEPDIHYTLLSDARMDAARAFHVAFQLDAKGLAEYRGYGIDLEATTGEKHHQLPVPAVFIIDRAGVIRFVHANPDFTTRLSPTELLAAARAVADSR